MDSIKESLDEIFWEDSTLCGFPVDVKCFQNPIHKSLANTFSSLSLNSNVDEIEKRVRQLKMFNAEVFPEFLSLEEYCTDLAVHGSSVDNLTGIQLKSPHGNYYTHIIPIYLSQSHFQRNESHLKTLISVICCGIDGPSKSPFHPSMFVKVYPALMNKQIVSFLRDKTYDSEMLVVAFSNLLRTYRYVCSRYPQVQEINDKHVLEFCSNEKYRTKEWTNDLGELLFKMAAVDKSKYPQCTFENMETKKVFFEEFFARQIFWVDKYAKEGGEYNFFNRFRYAATELLSNYTENYDMFRDECCYLLNQFFEASRISLRLLLFNIECLKTFVTPDFDNLLDSNYGLLDKERMYAFRKSMNEIEGMTHLSQFFQRTGCPLNTLEGAVDFIIKSLNNAQRLGYFSRHY
uniref:Uncharacterized protein n=1 Tax=Panagrolaimus superbus TaxID=310955 RepID=A0A914XSY0_9BILA